VRMDKAKIALHPVSTRGGPGNLSGSQAGRAEMVAHTGFEPVISSLDPKNNHREAPLYC